MTATSPRASVQIPPSPTVTTGTTASARAEISSSMPGSAIRSISRLAPSASGRETRRPRARRRSSSAAMPRASAPVSRLVPHCPPGELQGHRPAELGRGRDATVLVAELELDALRDRKAPVAEQSLRSRLPHPLARLPVRRRRALTEAAAATARSRTGSPGPRWSARTQASAVARPATDRDSAGGELAGGGIVEQVRERRGDQRSRVAALGAVGEAGPDRAPLVLVLGAQSGGVVIEQQQLVDRRIGADRLDDRGEQLAFAPDQRGVVERVTRRRCVREKLRQLPLGLVGQRRQLDSLLLAPGRRRSRSPRRSR